MREGWKYCKLGDVAEIIGGSTPDTKIKEYWEGDNCWVTPAELNGNKYQGTTERQISDLAVNRTNLKLLPTGTVLLSSRAPIGKVAITTMPMYCNQGFKNAICGKKLYNEYLYWYFIYSCDYLKSLGTGATFKEISKKTTENIIIPVPPIEEQQRIVTELDLLSSIIEKQKAQLRELDTLAQSIFYDMFGDPVTNEKGWEIKSIMNIGYVERGKGISKKDFVENGVPCIHYGQLHTTFSAFTTKHVSCIPENLLKKPSIAHKGDLVMAITSEDVECSCKSTAWMGDYDIIVGSDAAILHHNQNGIYLSYCTKTESFFNEKSKYAKGFKVTHISTAEIEQIPILIPPLPLQQQFADKIQSIESQKSAITKSIAETQKLFDYTMDKYFG